MPTLTKIQIARKLDRIESLRPGAIAPYTELEVLQRSRLHSFLKGAWDVLEPRRTLDDNWHLELIAEYLEAVAAGELKNVLINIAPRSLKSIEVSVCYPCWRWLDSPERRFLCLSYSASLANDLSDLRRSLIRSDWYRQLCRDSIRLSNGDRNSSQQTKNRISEFANNYRGQMIARGFDGSVTGSGGDEIICFPGWVKVKTDRGDVAIADLKSTPELRALTFNHEIRRLEYSEVLEYETGNSRPMVKIDFGARSLTCTEDHPIYIVYRGYVKACDLVEGDEALCYDAAFFKIKSVKKTQSTDRVYNIKTSNHNYFADGILVHNCDDPNNPDVGNNPALLTKTEKRFRDYSVGRKNSKETAIILIQQRTAKGDVSGVVRDRLNSEGDWQIILLPTSAKIYTEIKFPRSDRTIFRQPGDFLIPARHGEKEDAEAKRTLGAAMYASRHGQEPIDEESQVFKAPRIVSALPANYSLAMSVDSTFGSKSATASFACIGLWAIAAPNFFLIDVWRKKTGIVETKKAILDLRLRHATMGVIGYTLIELKANGSSLIEELETEIPGLLPISPRESKRARAEAIAPIFDTGNVFLLEDASWNQEYILELIGFPGENDDQVDMTSQLIAFYLNKWRRAKSNQAAATTSLVY